MIIPYFPLPDEAMKKIIELKLAKIQRRLPKRTSVALTYDPAVLEEVAPAAAPKWKAERATWTTS